ncbi:MAG: PorT family protein [Bacteroidales bacterium]|nr:PorT family protein [Bacteroidales bacterium]
MKPLLSLTLLLVFTLTSLKAQKFYGNAILGINGAQVDGDTQSGYKKAGLKLGFDVSLFDEKKVSYETGLNFSSKGAIDKVNGFTQFKISLNYIEIPFLLNIRFLEKFSFIAGASYNYLISSKITESNGTQTKDPEYLKNYDINAVTGLKIDIPGGFELRAVFNYTLGHITLDPDMKYWRNNVLNLSIVKKFGLKK